MLVIEVLAENLLCLIAVFDWNFLGDQAGQGMDNGAITDFVVILAIGSEPFVTVDLQNGLHQELGPDFVVVCGPWEDWLSLVVLVVAAWHSVIDLDEALFAHESKLDPILSCRRDYWQAVFLRVDPLPDGLGGLSVPDASVSNELELRSDPLCVFGHQEAHIKASIDGDLNQLGLVRWIGGGSSLGWSSLLLGAFVSGCGLLGDFFSLSYLSFRLEPLHVANNLGLRHQVILVDGLFGVLECFKLGLLLLGHIHVFDGALSGKRHQSVLSCSLSELEFSLLFSSPSLNLFLKHDFFDVLLRSEPHGLTFGEVMETWREVILAHTIHGFRLRELLPNAVFVLFESGFEVMRFGLFVTRPNRWHRQRLKLVSARHFRFTLHASNTTFTRGL